MEEGGLHPSLQGSFADHHHPHWRDFADIPDSFKYTTQAAMIKSNWSDAEAMLVQEPYDPKAIHTFFDADNGPNALRTIIPGKEHSKMWVGMCKRHHETYQQAKGAFSTTQITAESMDVLHQMQTDKNKKRAQHPQQSAQEKIAAKKQKMLVRFASNPVDPFLWGLPLQDAVAGAGGSASSGLSGGAGNADASGANAESVVVLEEQEQRAKGKGKGNKAKAKATPPP